MSDDFASWREALAGGKPGLHEDEPWCGYFKMRDRRGKWLQVAPIKRPFIGCAIWKDEAGNYCAEFDGEPVTIDRVWPHCARFPIPYETYAHWHNTEEWPLEAKSA